ncbi:MAG: terminase [Gluconobacter oxydans]
MRTILRRTVHNVEETARELGGGCQRLLRWNAVKPPDCQAVRDCRKHSAHAGSATPKRATPVVAEAIPDDIEGRLLCLAERMTDELEQITAHHGEISEAIEIETMDDENPRRREAMQKAISHPVRANSLKTLAQTVALLGRKGASKKGKKEQLKDAAETASSGRFAPMHQPKLVVNNGK